jgi:hypothetical protein
MLIHQGVSEIFAKDNGKMLEGSMTLPFFICPRIWTNGQTDKRTNASFQSFGRVEGMVAALLERRSTPHSTNDAVRETSVNA